MVPVEIIGKMTLNRNPENFFAETEQVAWTDFEYEDILSSCVA